MTQNTKYIFVVFISVPFICVAVQLSCDKVDPMQPSTLTCTCKHAKGNGILWNQNNMFMTDCYLKKERCLRHQFKGFSFSMNSSTSEYKFSVDFYNYSKCDVYTCRDISSPEVNATKTIAARDSTSVPILNISEPKTNHTSGFIGITTDCIYGAISEENYLDIQVLVVMGNVVKSFNPMKTTKRLLNGSCRLCDGDMATQFLIGFYHKEEMECGGKEAQFRIILSHNGNPSEQQNITTRNYYCVTDQAADKRTKKHNVVNIIIISCLLLILLLILQYTVLGVLYRSMENSNPLDAVSVEKKYLYLGFVPALGIIGIIAYLYSTNTEKLSTKVVSDKSIKDACLAEAEEKQLDNQSSGYQSLTSENSNEIPACLIKNRDHTLPHYMS